MPVVRSYADSAVVIAGASSGVGLASALAFVDAGVTRLALLSRSPERGEAARERVQARNPAATVEFIPVDVDDLAAVTRAVALAHQKLGGIDVLVSSVTSAYRPDLLSRIEPSDIAGILTGQALPPMYLTRTVLPYLKEQGGGSIVLVASDAAKVATPGESVLGAAMAAIVMFSRTAAMEAKRDGIRINAVTPSLIAGTATAARVLTDGFSKALFDKAATLAHLGVAEASDLAALIVFLGGPAAAKITGQAISVNGGISAA
ncbi:oxidoreductase [Subtercola boreus]|uniref:Oxidoreductase n=1 Tax=Subtercola boreus TaxID=120213 RepID=A0A3E0VM31_9MICO|nr:SDR family oxidoreductase [Subtercola boreus]RFA10490.1 oxidoreductase [Subtercola boreus]TQL55974.1 NAD(P)-dependent dehydrogenase (short-subunit alcohol dehydrogenase family) [Subtercola boreus]